MYRYKRLLVALNLSEQDSSTVQYASLVARLADSEKVHFVHVARTLDIPEAILRQYPEVLEPLDERAEHEMEKTVSEHFHPGRETKIGYEVVQGSALVELLRWARRKDADLIIVGKKRNVEQAGRIPMKLARKAHCSVMLVPEGTKPQITRILATTDFSEHSADAMDVAIAFGSASGQSEILCLHAYRIPIGFYKTGKTYEEFSSIMRKHAEDRYNDFVAGLELKGLKVTPLLILGDKPASVIEEVVKQRKVDLLLVGARGRGAAAAALLGSVTERLIESLNIPIIAVKKKGAGMGFLDALFKL